MSRMTQESYGLDWTKYVEKLVSLEENMDNVVNECERKTGMHLIMVAAMGNHNDLDTIYNLLIRGPDVVMGKYFETKYKKRKRQAAIIGDFFTRLHQKVKKLKSSLSF